MYTHMCIYIKTNKRQIYIYIYIYTYTHICHSSAALGDLGNNIDNVMQYDIL